MSESSVGREFVIVPTGYDPGSYACVRSLSEQGVGTIIASEYDNVPAAISRFCDLSVTVPSPYDDLSGYTDTLLELARRPAVRTILPLRPHDPYIFAVHEEAFAPHVSLVVPDIETLEVVHDRMKLYDAAVDAGVPVPETRRLGDAVGWDTDTVVKSRYNVLADRYVPDIGPDRVETVKSVEHVRAGETMDVAELRERMHHEPIAQEFVDASGEYVFAALYDHGEPLATFQHRQVRGDSYTGGGGVFRRSVFDPDLERVGRALLDSIEWHGLACIEYAKDAETGEFKLLEVNPRFWQSLPCAVRAGADFPHYYWLQATDREEKIDPDYRTGVGTHLLYGEMGYLWSLLDDDSPLRERPSLSRETLSVLGSCLTSPNFDDFRLDDPRPFIRGLWHVASK